MELEDVEGGTGGGGVVRAGGTDVEDGGMLGVGRDVVVVVDGGAVIVGGGIRSGVVVGGVNVGGDVVEVVREGENGDADGSVLSGGVTGCLFCITN
ncbi:MAG TPA: hypothetical protein DDZ88_23135 [Verrucomicrobiales bacterium]|nr:hypothetical protein [Verrucomicrobiales bacterium]